MKKEKQKRKGFTLLELLVVVLIIGIFAAVALPQYELTIDKTTFSSYQIIVKNLADAYWRHMLVNNEAPTDIDDLDISLPMGYTKTNKEHFSCAVFEGGYCCIAAPNYGASRGNVICGKNDYSFAITQGTVADNINLNSTSKGCYAKNNNSRAIRLCESLPYYEKISTWGMVTPEGRLTGYFTYLY